MISFETGEEPGEHEHFRSVLCNERGITWQQAQINISDAQSRTYIAQHVLSFGKFRWSSGGIESHLKIEKYTEHSLRARNYRWNVNWRRCTFKQRT